MTEHEFNLIRAAGFLLAAALAVTLQRWQPHAGIAWPWRANVGLWAVNLVVIGLVCGGCACTTARWAAAGGIGMLNVGSVPRELGIPVTVVVLDLVSYLWHRANHHVRWLWRFHQVHHSDAGFRVSTAVRFHPGELLLSLPARLAAVVLLGAPVAGIVVFEILFTIANFIEHGDIALPLAIERGIGRWCVTPALHRRHHARRDPDHNFGTVLVVWDRWLGTYADSSSAVHVDTGLADIAETPELAAALALPLRLHAATH